ncbi:MAG: YceI family protein [Chitinophagales bacterium]|nr:YceI family protein [Chitinophagales bacterium]
MSLPSKSIIFEIPMRHHQPKYLGLFFICSLFLVAANVPAHNELFTSHNGEITFLSYAPLEVITARSNEMQGAIDPVTRTFLFTVNVNTFHGFNSGLQQIHFNENYLETDVYPKATFDGKIIESVDFNIPGKYEVRAKGKLTIHGIPQERIINGAIEVFQDHIVVQSKFPVLLEDHQIKVPKVVYQKIAPEIDVTLHADLKKVSD